MTGVRSFSIAARCDPSPETQTEEPVVAFSVLSVMLREERSCRPRTTTLLDLVCDVSRCQCSDEEVVETVMNLVDHKSVHLIGQVTAKDLRRE